ncbi:hypothetical protein [Virgisporangium ochraceum]|uniref:hypothetical protein n=1 Tax=Virgisporangium ochraceum TaxID=65505 RepID=UPI001944F0D9|nr:hypothetical protein [Virgisporangium ochraceum]
MTSTNVPRPPAWQVLGGLGVAVLSAAAWFGWMGWDTEYDVDPVTQVSSGPYEVWQVLGCGATLLLVLVGALLTGVRAAVACAAMTLAFTAAWTATAATSDGGGLFVVGGVLVLIGLATATTVVAVVTEQLRRRPAAR